MQESETDSSVTSAASLVTVPDEAAIECIRAGDTRYFEVIMRRHNQRLFRVARSILRDDDSAQDAVQEAYVSVFYKLDQFSPGGNFGAWLTRITVNEALMIKRKNRKHEKDLDTDHLDDRESVDHSARQRTDPADVMANSELAQLIEAAVDQLPDDFRTVFVLRAIQQLSVKETAESLDIKEATVKTRFHRARNLMQETLNRYMDMAGLRVFEFAGKRCDDMVVNVLKRLGAHPPGNGDLEQLH